MTLRLQFAPAPITLTDVDTIIGIPTVSYGLISNYYHFVMGALLPLLELYATEKLEITQTVIIPTAGDLDRHWRHFTDIGLVNVSTVRGDPRAAYPRAPLIALESFDSFCSWQGGLPLYRPGAVSRTRLADIVGFVCSRLRMLKPRRSIASDLVLVDRGEAHKRAIPNLSEIADRLTDKGLLVERVFPERMTLSQQVALYRHTRVVVAQHGAALVNLVWTASLDRSPSVVEVIPPCRDNAHYYDILCKVLICDYQKISQDSDKKSIPFNELLTAIERCETIKIAAV